MQKMSIKTCLKNKKKYREYMEKTDTETWQKMEKQIKRVLKYLYFCII